MGIVDGIGGSHTSIVDAPVLTLSLSGNALNGSIGYVYSPVTWGAILSTLPSISMISRQGEVWFSERQELDLTFTNLSADVTNKQVTMNIYYHNNIDGLNTYLSDKANRVLCADILARGFNLCFLDVSIVAYNSTTPDATTCTNTINTYLDSLAPGQPFIMSDLLSGLYTAGIQTIQTPLGITYNKYWKDLFNNTTGVITDVMNPNDPLNIFVVNTVTTSVEGI